jgi:hypothetical protein
MVIFHSYVSLPEDIYIIVIIMVANSGYHMYIMGHSDEKKVANSG